MSEYVIQGNTLTGIADAIRQQLGTQQQYTPESMASAIESIQGGGTKADIDSILSRTISGSYSNDTAESLGLQCFASCVNLERVWFKSCKSIANSAFQSCSLLSTAVFDKLNSIGDYSFSNCKMLECFAMRGETICKLSYTTAFNNTPIASGTGFIYVPDDLVKQYKVSTNWAAYADQIKGLSEIPEEVQEWLSSQNP